MDNRSNKEYETVHSWKHGSAEVRVVRIYRTMATGVRLDMGPSLSLRTDRWVMLLPPSYITQIGKALVAVLRRIEAGEERGKEDIASSTAGVWYVGFWPDARDRATTIIALCRPYRGSRHPRPMYMSPKLAAQVVGVLREVWATGQDWIEKVEQHFGPVKRITMAVPHVQLDQWKADDRRERENRRRTSPKLERQLRERERRRGW